MNLRSYSYYGCSVFKRLSLDIEGFKINQSDFCLNGTFSSRYLQIECMVIFIKKRREMNICEYLCESVLDAFSVAYDISSSKNLAG